MDPWFLYQMREICEAQKRGFGEHGTGDGNAETSCARPSAWDLATSGCRMSGNCLVMKASNRCGNCATSIGIRPIFKLVDTCAAEFESYTPYFYSALRRRR